MNCVIADDEEPARLLLNDYISKVNELNLIQSFTNGLEARNFLENNKVDLAFLDINMPELSGTSLVRLLKQKPLIVFTTAYSEYAIEGFELDIIDYLTKPFSFERFLKSINKAKQYSQFIAKSESSIQNYFFVKADYKIVKVNFNEILYIEGLREYVRIHTLSKKIITLLAMSKLESELPVDRFIRVHKSSIVNLDFVNAIHNNIIEIGDHRIAIGGTYKDAVDRRLHERGLY